MEGLDNIGGHTSIAGGVSKAFKLAKDRGHGAMQIFVKNQAQWKGKPLEEREVEKFKAAWEELPLTHIISHASYLINLAAPDDALWQKSQDALVDELERGATLGLAGAVLHPGAPKDAGEAFGVKRIAEGLNRIFDEHGDLPIRVYLENTAGQGSTLGRTFEQLRDIIDGVEKKERLGICLDSCHLFAAGYDLRDEESYTTTMEAFDSIVGFQWLQAWHLNDSKKPLGSRVDRHDNIGEGHMGIDPFTFIMNDHRFDDIPLIVETPDPDTRHATDAAKLRSLRTS